MTFEHLVIHRRHGPDDLVLALYGELDLLTAPRLRRELTEAVTDGRDRIVIDLSGLEFMDSSGLHVLLEASERARGNDHRLSLRSAPPRVHRLFELTGTIRRFDFAS
jgi:anti-sigma B factor antagonist